MIDPFSKEDSNLIMELVYDPETSEVHLTAVCGLGGGWIKLSPLEEDVWNGYFEHYRDYHHGNHNRVMQNNLNALPKDVREGIEKQHSEGKE